MNSSPFKSGSEEATVAPAFERNSGIAPETDARNWTSGQQAESSGKRRNGGTRYPNRYESFHQPTLNSYRSNSPRSRVERANTEGARGRHAGAESRKGEAVGDFGANDSKTMQLFAITASVRGSRNYPILFPLLPPSLTIHHRVERVHKSFCWGCDYVRYCVNASRRRVW